MLLFRSYRKVLLNFWTKTCHFAFLTPLPSGVGGKTPIPGGLTCAQGPHVTYDRRAENQTNAEHNVSLLHRSCLQLCYRPPDAFEGLIHCRPLSHGELTLSCARPSEDG